MSKIVGLDKNPLFKNEPHAGMISILEKALEKAKAGELRGLGIIFVNREGQVHTKAENIDAKHALVAGCAYLQYDICDAKE